MWFFSFIQGTAIERVSLGSHPECARQLLSCAWVGCKKALDESLAPLEDGAWAFSYGLSLLHLYVGPQ